MKAFAIWFTAACVVIGLAHLTRVQAYRSGFDAGVKATACGALVKQTGGPRGCMTIDCGQREYAIGLGIRTVAEARKTRP